MECAVCALLTSANGEELSAGEIPIDWNSFRSYQDFVDIQLDCLNASHFSNVGPRLECRLMDLYRKRVVRSKLCDIAIISSAKKQLCIRDGVGDSGKMCSMYNWDSVELLYQIRFFRSELCFRRCRRFVDRSMLLA